MNTSIKIVLIAEKRWHLRDTLVYDGLNYDFVCFNYKDIDYVTYYRIDKVNGYFILSLLNDVVKKSDFLNSKKFFRLHNNIKDKLLKAILKYMENDTLEIID